MKYEIIKGGAKDFEGMDDGLDGVFTIYRFIGDVGVRESKYPSTALMGDIEIIAERRPVTELVWDGEGVPCVGQKVMTKSGEGIIDYVGSGVIVYSNNDEQWSVRCDSLDYALSAISSPEDVARDEAIEAMIYAARPIDHTTLRGLVEILYDAGYRKK